MCADHEVQHAENAQADISPTALQRCSGEALGKQRGSPAGETLVAETLVAGWGGAKKA